MHLRVLSQWLEDRAVIRHAARASTFARVVRALLTGGKLSLTHLGRSLDGAAKEKHRIKAVDRLLGNQHLHGERDAIYAAIARTLLLGNLRPIVREFDLLQIAQLVICVFQESLRDVERQVGTTLTEQPASVVVHGFGLYELAKESGALRADLSSKKVDCHAR